MTPEMSLLGLLLQHQKQHRKLSSNYTQNELSSLLNSKKG
jgi:hypothetical protein